MVNTGTYTSFTGEIDHLPQNTSDGLKFLAKYLDAIDSLDQKSVPVVLDRLIAPSTTFCTNGRDPVPAKRVQQMFNKRAEMLSDFSHTRFPLTAFDLVVNGSKRSIVCECVSM
jgi:hypothetical protein